MFELLIIILKKQSTITGYPENVSTIILACIALHNYIMETKLSMYCPSDFVDSYDSNGILIPGKWNDTANPMKKLRKLGSNNATSSAFEIRNQLIEYFNNVGKVSWQDKMFHNVANL